MLKVLYNEIDTFACAWLEQLMKAGLISDGTIDGRSIADLRPEDLEGYDRVHFFAGVAGWEHALNLAGWGGRSVWTGSCPCQPYSAAGKRRGDADERNLWPVWFRLIAECRPDVVFGEQVESAIGMGWLDGVHADLEGEGYALGAAVLGAHSVGAPHIRQRLYWMADAGRIGDRQRRGPGEDDRAAGADRGKVRDRAQRLRPEPDAGGVFDGRLADADLGAGGQGREDVRGRLDRSDALSRPGPGGGGVSGGMGNASGQGPALGSLAADGRGTVRHEGAPTAQTGLHSFWSRAEGLACSDGKARRVESPLQSLVDGLPGSLEPLRSGCVEEIERAVTAHASALQATRHEIMRDLWGSLCAAAAGERAILPDEALLLAVLHQLAAAGWRVAEGIPRQSQEAAQRLLRGLWREAEGTPRPPYRSRLEEQRPDERPDAVHQLSLVLAPLARQAWQEALDRHAAAVFPLARGVVNRVGTLRGAGNAIVPQVAAEFIRAYLDISN